jgi:VCBS repeat-containing protein
MITNVNEAPTDIALSSTSIPENQPVGTTVGTLTDTDPDIGDTATYTLACGGTDNSAFTIPAGTNKLQAATMFDFETKASYSICIEVKDSGGLTFDKPFTITILNRNDPPSDIQLSSSSVAENQPAGTFVGSLTSTDQDLPPQTFTYTLVSGTGSDDNASFKISGSQLLTNVSFDFETKASYTIRVRTTDSGTPVEKFEKVFTITITDVNDPPTDITLSPSSVAENQPAGTVVGTLADVDQDAGATATYALDTAALCPGTDNSSFQIGPGSNQLKTAASFNFEAKSSYSICVKATDNGGLTFDKELTVAITDVNEAPTDIQLSSSSVAENLAAGATVGTLTDSDPDAGDTATYTLACGGTDNSSFQITGNQLLTNASFDFETKASYSICIEVKDKGGLTFDKPFTITITNVNDAPTDIQLSSSTVAENQPSGTTVGTLSATDQDVPAQTMTYALVDAADFPDNNAFQISGSTLLTNASFDFETKSSYSIRVQVTDNGTPAQSFQKTLTVNVTNVNEAPTDITLTPSMISFGQPAGTTVGTLAAVDPDAGDTATFALACAGTDNASFQISGNKLQTAVGGLAVGTYSICVRATDSGTLTFDKTLTVTVSAQNFAPTDIQLSATTIAENQPSGTPVGTLSDTDPNAGDSATYTLACSGADNGSFQISGNQLQTAASFDFETKAIYSICIRVTDSGGLTFDKPFTIVVTDVNEAPTDIQLSNQSVPEDQIATTLVGTLSATDPDSGQTFTYTLVGGTGSDDNSSFQIPAGTNQLETNQSFDFETKSSYSIRIRVTDSGTPNLSFEKVFTISILNINESPTDISLSPSSLPENQPAGTTVGTLTATDPDAGQTATFALVQTGACPGTDNSSFQIVSGNQLQSTASFDFETKSSYSICVRATDNGTPPLHFDKTLTVTVTNVNEAPVAVDDALSSVAEDSGQRSIPAATLLANDSDPDGQTLTVTAVSSPVGGTVSLSGSTVLFTPAADFNGAASFQYTVSDTGSPPLTATATAHFTVTEVNDPPVAGADSLTAIDEDSGQRTISKASLLANDSPGPANESGQTLDITAVSNPVGGTVSISGANVLFNPTLNYNGPASFDYTVTDNGTTNGAPDPKSATGHVTFTINAVNDAPVLSGPGSVGTTLDTDKALTGFSVTDVDSGSDPVTLTLSVLNGKLTLGTGVSGGLVAGDITGNGTGSVSVTASVAKIDATLADGAGLVYHSNGSPFAGPTDTLHLGVDDLGHNGSGGNKTDAKTVTIAFTLPPTANAQSLSTLEDTAKTVTLSGSDPQSQPLTFIITTLPSAGQLYEGTSTGGTPITTVPHTLPGGGSQVTYMPAPNDNGTGHGSFNFKVNDGTLDSAAATVTLDVTPVDDPPVAVDDSFTVVQDSGANTLDVMANDTDIDGGINTVQSVTQGTHGTVAITNGGANVSYTPAAGYCSATPDTFTYTLNGGSQATVSVKVTCLNQPPVANPDSGAGFSTDQNTPIDTGNVLTNDTDPDGDTLSVVSMDTTGTKGTVTNKNDGTFHYDPGTAFVSLAAGQTGTDTFKYTISDGHGHTASATVTITITGLNDPPVAVNDHATTTEDATILIPVLANDSDPDNDTLLLSGVETPDNGGTATVIGDQIQFNPGFAFQDLNVGQQRVTTFTYDVTDGTVFVQGTVTVTVTGLDDPPHATVDVYTSEDQSVPAGLTLAVGTSPSEPHISVPGSVLDNDTDIDTPHANLTATAGTTSVNGGVVAMNPDGTFSYTAPAGFRGTDEIDYVVHDNAPSGDLTANGKIFVQVIGPEVWFVNPAASSCAPTAICGTAKAPFPTLDPLSGPSRPDGPGDVIFVYSGGSATSNGFTLKQGETLLGEPAGLSVTDENGLVHNLLGPVVKSNPTITNTAGAGLTLANNTNVDGVTVSGSSGDGIFGSSITTATVGSLANVQNNGGYELDLTGGGFGTINFGAKIVNGAAGGAIRITSSNNIVNVTGLVSDTSGTGTGILLQNLSNSQVLFTGGVKLSTGANDAFTVKSGAVSVDNSGSIVNTLATTGGTALNFQNAKILSAGLTFQSISDGTSSGSTGDGIIVANTAGSTGGLVVTGTGTPGSGGTIQHKTGADGDPTSGIGIYLNTTAEVSLAWMQLNDFDNFAIRGDKVTDFSLQNSVVNGASGNSSTIADSVNAAAIPGEDAIRLTDPRGDSNFIVNSKISGGFTNTILAEDTGNLFADSPNLVIDNCTIGGRSGAGMKDGIHLQSDGNGTIFSATVSNSILTAAGSDLIEGYSNTGAELDPDIENNTMTNNYSGTDSNSNGIKLTGLGDLNYTINQNTIDLHGANGGTGVGGSAILVGSLPTADGDFDGAIDENIIGTAGDAHSAGGATAPGISVLGQGTGTHTVAVRRNTISHYGLQGIFIQGGNGNGVMNATVLGNTTTSADGGSSATGLTVVSGLVIGDSYVTNILIGGAPGPDQNDFRFGNPGTSTDVSLTGQGAGSTLSKLKLSFGNAPVTSNVPGVILANNLSDASGPGVTSVSQSNVNRVSTVPPLP